MEKFAVAISRQFGSMGRLIGQRLSELLDVEYLDREIIEMTAKSMGLPVSVVSNEEDAVKAGIWGRSYPLGVGEPRLQDEIFENQSNIIKDYAEKDSCIIVGRCGEYVLKDHPNILRVYIYAPYETRIKNCLDNLGIDQKSAKHLISDVDSARENYHKLYVPEYDSPFDNKDICIDSSRFGIEGTALILSNIIRVKL